MCIRDRCRVIQQTLDPSRTALVVFDMLECYRQKIEAAGAIEPVTRLIAACRQHGVAICYARADHRPDGADANRTRSEVNEEFEPWGPEGPVFGFAHPPETMAVLKELEPQPSDYDIPKPVSYTHLRAHETVLDLVCRL